MSDYPILEDDHIDDQETINVGNLIIDLESDLEKEKIVNEQAKYNVDPTIISKCNHPSKCKPSSTSQLGRASSSSSNKSKQSSISSTRECGTSTSIGTITEPECHGPCEPGTSVTLEGIVWQETEGGILVVNVTWRGKTHVGALLDCTRHDWAPPRLCDSPASDIDAKTSKGVRPKRIVTRSNGIGIDEKNLLQTTGKLRNGKGRRIPPTNEPTCSKRQRETNDKSSNETSSAQPEANTPQNNILTTESDRRPPPQVVKVPNETNDKPSIETSPNETPQNNMSSTEPERRPPSQVVKVPNETNDKPSNETSSSETPQNNMSSTESERRPPPPPPPPPQVIKNASDVQKPTEPLSHGSSSSRAQPAPTTKQSPQVKQASNQPPINSAEEGMKPSGTSTGPPPAPHQANCFFNPSFMANSYHPYALHPYLTPRHMFDSMPPIPTSNSAMLSRIMNNMRNPPPPDSPSRLLSPSMPKNVPYGPFKLEPGGVLPPPQQLHSHQIPTSIALPGMPPMTNPSMAPIPPIPPMQPIPPLSSGQSNLRMPSQGDSILPSTSQPPFLPLGSLNPAHVIPGMGNPLAPHNMPNLIEEQMAKQFPRRLN